MGALDEEFKFASGRPGNSRARPGAFRPSARMLPLDYLTFFNLKNRDQAFALTVNRIKDILTGKIATRITPKGGLQVARFPGTTTYFATVMADTPWMYWRLDESASPVIDHGSEGLNLNIAGPTLTGQSAVIVDPDSSMHFRESPFYGFFQHDDCGLYRSVQGRVATLADIGPLAWSAECWFYQDSVGPDHPGFGQSNWLTAVRRPTSADSQPFCMCVLGGTDLVFITGNWDYPGLGLNCFTQYSVPGVVSVGAVYHVVVTFDAGSGWNGDGNSLGSTGVFDVWVNGVRVQHNTGQCSIRQNFFGPVASPNPQYLVLGTDAEFGGSGGADGAFSIDGRLDEVAFYKYALSPSQIAHHFAVGQGDTGAGGTDQNTVPVLASTGANGHKRGRKIWVQTTDPVSTGLVEAGDVWVK